MNIKQYTPWLAFAGVVIIIALLLDYNTTTRRTTASNASSFSTEKPQKRTIISMIKTKGILVPNTIIKIGNLINGIIRALYVDEYELVEEGQLLAEIDDAREDADVNSAFGALDAAQAVLFYQFEFLKRQQELFKFKQISLDTLQQAQRDYEAAYAKVEQAKGTYEAAKLTYDNKRIISPVSGMIIGKAVSLGEAVNNYSPATVIYAIAENIKQLKAHIILDEVAVGKLELNATVSMTIDTYPHRTFTGVVHEITNSSLTAIGPVNYTYVSTSPVSITGPTSYRAIALVDNNDISLRPGMTLSAQITVAEKENALSVPLQTFKVNRHAVQLLANEIGYGYEPLDAKQLLAVSLSDTTKSLWICTNKKFIEKAVEVGVSDADYFEVKDGISESDEILYEISESRSVKNFFSRLINKPATT
jgi:HlyD family secretion protein